MAADFTEEFVDVGGVRIHMLKGGSGDPLVIFHGSGGNSGWLRYVQELAGHYTVYFAPHDHVYRTSGLLLFGGRWRGERDSGGDAEEPGP